MLFITIISTSAFLLELRQQKQHHETHHVLEFPRVALHLLVSS